MSKKNVLIVKTWNLFIYYQVKNNPKITMISIADKNNIGYKFRKTNIITYSNNIDVIITYIILIGNRYDRNFGENKYGH